LTVGVVIADRSAFVRLAVRNALVPEGIAVLAEAEDTNGAWRAIVTHRPDVVLLDTELDEDLALLASVRDAQPRVGVIMLSPDDSEIRALAAVRAGACGFLPKDTSPDRLPDIVRGTLAGEAAIPRRVVRRLLERIATPPAQAETATTGAADALTTREWEVLERLARNMTDRHIGAELGVSEVTVRRHAATAARKLHTGRREDTVAAFRRMVA
jgi:DNA-binding NarL/FixJ family response regulator